MIERHWPPFALSSSGWSRSMMQLEQPCQSRLLTGPLRSSPVRSIAARARNLTGLDVLTSRGNRALCRVRFAVMLAAALHGCSPVWIGRYLNRDHSTVHHGLRRAAQLMEADADFATLVRELVQWV